MPADGNNIEYNSSSLAFDATLGSVGWARFVGRRQRRVVVAAAVRLSIASSPMKLDNVRSFLIIL